MFQNNLLNLKKYIDIIISNLFSIFGRDIHAIDYMIYIYLILKEI